MKGQVRPLAYSELSVSTLSLWAKVSNTESSADWLPLIIHHSDTSLIIEHLWNTWLSPSDISVI